MLSAAYLIGPRQLAAVARAFPALSLHAVAAAPAGVPLVDAEALFAGRSRGWACDRSLDGATAVAIAADSADRALALLTRLQRLMERRNRHSDGAVFDLLLARHRELHDLTQPLVRADFDHARDVWQWLLRLEPEASLPLQIAALFHDVERLESEAAARVEQQAADYQRFKDAHARAGAALLERTLAELPLPPGALARAATLVAAHETAAAGEREQTFLADADALSFFSLNSSGYLDYFGQAQTARKIAWTWQRLSPRGRGRLLGVQLRPEVRALLHAAMACAEVRA